MKTVKLDQSYKAYIYSFLFYTDDVTTAWSTGNTQECFYGFMPLEFKHKKSLMSTATPQNKLVRWVIYAWNMKKKKRNTTKCRHVFFKSKGYGGERNKNSALQFLSCMLFQLPEQNAVHSTTFCMAEDTESFSFWEELKIYFKSIQSKR